MQYTDCPKSPEPRGILFHPDTTHFLGRFTMFVRIFLNIFGSTVAQQSVILCLRWWRSRILTAYTCAFRNPQNAKSRGLRSGDRGAHSTVPLLPIHRWGIKIPIDSKTFWTSGRMVYEGWIKNHVVGNGRDIFQSTISECLRRKSGQTRERQLEQPSQDSNWRRVVTTPQRLHSKKSVRMEGSYDTPGVPTNCSGTMTRYAPVVD
jgi:hypothetical protein